MKKTQNMNPPQKETPLRGLLAGGSQRALTPKGNSPQGVSWQGKHKTRTHLQRGAPGEQKATGVTGMGARGRLERRTGN